MRSQRCGTGWGGEKSSLQVQERNGTLWNYLKMIKAIKCQKYGGGGGETRVRKVILMGEAK